jgi:beta-glucanase (GH16 family)
MEALARRDSIEGRLCVVAGFGRPSTPLGRLHKEIEGVTTATSFRLPSLRRKLRRVRRSLGEGGKAEATLRALVLVLAVVLPEQSLLNAGRNPLQAPSWELVWSDEFDKPGLPDPAKWSYEVGGHGWGNQELQFYTEGRRENARVEDGRLIVEARREDWQGSRYTSARLNSRPGWSYGRIEARAKLPRGRGTWPAIWMLPVKGGYGKGGWPDNGEIDIMEHVGFDPGVIHGTIHTGAYNHAARTQRGGTTTVADAQDAFHVYAVEWDAARIRWFVDDREYFSFAKESGGKDVWPFDAPFHLLLNVAVGGTWGGEKGIDEDAFPLRMEVDYVRVYQ